MNYAQWYTQYMTVYKTKLAPRTREEYDRQQRKYLAPFLGSMELEDITPEDVQLCLVLAADRGGPRQSQAVYSLIHAVMRRAYRSRLILWNPVDALDKPEHTQEQGKMLTDADLQLALPFIRQELAVALALFAGLRRCEIAGLQWGDVDLAAGLLRIRRQRQRSRREVLVRVTKSGAGLRDVPIAPELRPILKHRFRLQPSGWVIPHAPEYPGNLWKDIQDHDVRLSQRYRLHDLRHHYGSDLILKGANIKAVSYLMGHSSVEITLKVYSHIYPEQAAAEARKVYGETSLTAP